MVDFTRHKLYELIERGDFRAISFYLTRKGGFTPPKDGNAGDTNVNVVVQSVKIVSVPSGTFLPAAESVVRDAGATRFSQTIEGELEDLRTEADL